MWKQFVLSIAYCLVIMSAPFAAENNNYREDDRYAAVLAGYGFTHIGLGKTTERVESIDLIPRYGIVRYHKLNDRWYSGRHDVFIEVPISMIITPETAPMVGVNFLAAWQFLSLSRGTPYMFAGGGPVYTTAQIPGLGSKLNGNYQAGIGFAFPRQSGCQFNVEYRLHHISNGGIARPNTPLNSSKFLLGMTF
jgi:hypothetical protein